MSDYIKREDALNAFNNAFYSGLAAKIKEIPSADVAPVVRCRDCLFCQMELYDGADEPWCDVHNKTVDTEAFCSWGERKDDETI